MSNHSSSWSSKIPNSFQSHSQKETKEKDVKNQKRDANDTHKSRPCQGHSFITDLSDVKQMEQGLLSLLDDFHSGKLRAFGSTSTFDKMDAIRERQEQLARLHFDLDAEHDSHGVDTVEGKRKANDNMNKLISHLQDLSSSIQDLYPKDKEVIAERADHTK